MGWPSDNRGQGQEKGGKQEAAGTHEKGRRLQIRRNLGQWRRGCDLFVRGGGRIRDRGDEWQQISRQDLGGGHLGKESEVNAYVLNTVSPLSPRKICNQQS